MEFHYRLKSQKEKIGSLELEIASLENLNETIDAVFAYLEATGNPAALEELCPYFGTLWPSGRALAETIVEFGTRLEGAEVLELGCGLALPSLVAARLGARVTATDFHPEVPKFLERNLAANELRNVHYARLDWRKEVPDLGRFDWVVASDVLYESHQTAALARVIDATLKRGGRTVIADPARPYLQAFVDELGRRGYRHQVDVRTVPDEPKAVDVFVVTAAVS